MSRRTDRLDEQFREEIGKLLQKGLKDPRVSSLASITRVTITDDLSYAKVMVSVMGSDKEKRDSLIGLEDKLLTGKCICCGKDAKHNVIWGKSY